MEKISWTDRVRNEEGTLTGLVKSCAGTAF